MNTKPDETDAAHQTDKPEDYEYIPPTEVLRQHIEEEEAEHRIKTTKHKTKERQPTEKHWLLSRLNTNVIQAIFSCLIFFATAFYAVFSYFQWQAMRDSIYLENAAVVNVSEIQLNEYMKGTEDETNVNINISIINTGRSPALNIHVTYFLNYFTKPLPKNLNDSISTYEQNQAVLAAGKSASFVIKFKLAHAERDSIFEKNQRACVWGTIEYNDIFKCRHATDFCAFNDENGSVIFSFCEGHNTMRAIPTDQCKQNSYW